MRSKPSDLVDACFTNKGTAGRGATFITFAGTDPVVLANWISDFDTHLTSVGVAEGYAEAASIVLDRIKEIATKRPNPETKLFAVTTASAPPKLWPPTIETKA